MDNGINKRKRIEVIDALRGFAVCSILLIHTSNHFLYGQVFSTFPDWLNRLDKEVLNLLYFLFEGKSYSIFALLFGFTMALMLEKGRTKSRWIEGRMYWRLCGLLVFGILNAMCFAGGDPLVFYALLMGCVIPMRRLSTGMLSVCAVFFLLQPLEILNEIYSFKPQVCGELYSRLHTVLLQGDLGMTLLKNIQMGLPACLWWAWESGRASQTLGLFCLGMIAYRIRFFRLPVSEYRRILIFTLPAAMALKAVAMYVSASVPVLMYSNLSASFTLVSFFCWIYYRFPAFKIWRWLALYGKMSLSHFIAQSLFGAFLFYPWGLYCRWGVTGSIALAILFFTIQLLAGKWWLEHHQKGPLEELWHKQTWIGGCKF